MNETPTGKPKFHVTQHLPDKDGQVRIEFRRWPEDILPKFWSTVPESQVETEIQKYQEWAELDEERQQEIARRLYGAK